jgi:hypothetical protein
LNDLFFARSQMGMSLAFHIIFAVIGMAMPLLMAVSEGCYLWTKKPIFLELSKRWAAGTTILFAVGAVSGTVLSFELGLLWPKFMQYAGVIIGMPFSLEGFAFFTEAIFLGIYLYGSFSNLQRSRTALTPSSPSRPKLRTNRTCTCLHILNPTNQAEPSQRSALAPIGEATSRKKIITIPPPGGVPPLASLRS